MEPQAGSAVRFNGTPMVYVEEWRAHCREDKGGEDYENAYSPTSHRLHGNSNCT
jgi:hypothetical protein